MNAAPRPWKSAIGWAIACSVLFLVVYNGCNQYAASLPNVPTWSFAWETRIPFVPLMIIPYWSLDLFFVVAFFVCRTPAEQRRLASRLALAISAAGACFLLFPLRLTFPRPEVEGFLGMWFAALRSFDQPHNLAPSLHIAQRTILWPVFMSITSGMLNGLLRVWFVLIGVSTLFTYQHQVMDVVTGWILAVFCLYVFAAPNAAFDNSRRVRNGFVGLLYFAAALLLLLAVVVGWPWSALLMWPATACGLLALAYWWLGALVYEKTDGQLALGTRLLLAPVLWGQYLSLAYYRRQCHPWDEVAPGVLIGRRLNAAEARDAISQGVTAVLDLTAEFSESVPFIRSTTYCNIPILDLTAPTPAQLDEAVAFIRRESRRGSVYVHCKIGYSRSGAAVGAWLLDTGLAHNVDEAIQRLRRVRPSIIVRPEAVAALDAFQAGPLAGGNADGPSLGHDSP